MPLKVLDVFEHERCRTVVRDNLRRIKEQRALRVAQKTMRAPQRVLLRHARDREGLAREATQQQVVLGDQRGIGGIVVDVARQRMIVAEVQRIRLLCMAIPLRGEHAVPAYSLKADPQAADSGKQVDEAEGHRARRRRCTSRGVLQYPHCQSRRLCVTGQVAFDRARRYRDQRCRLGPRQPRARDQCANLAVCRSKSAHACSLCRFATPWRKVAQQSNLFSRCSPYPDELTFLRSDRTPARQADDLACDRGPSAHLAREPREQICSSSCSSWLHLLRSWSSDKPEAVHFPC